MEGDDGSSGLWHVVSSWHYGACRGLEWRTIDGSIEDLDVISKDFVSGAEEGQVYAKRGSGKFGGGTSNCCVRVLVGTSRNPFRLAAVAQRVKSAEEGSDEV